MCSGSEAGSYLRLIDFVYHSTLGLRVKKRKKKKWLKCVLCLQRSETELTLDANHPLAGKALNFEVPTPSKVNL